MLKQSLAALMLLTAFASAHAQSQPATPFYVGVDLGKSRIDDDHSSNKTSYGAFGGYKFNDHFAAELSLRHLAKDGDGKLMQAGLTVVATAPLTNDFSLLLVWAITVCAFLLVKAASENLLPCSALALHQINKQVSLRAEFQRYRSNITSLNAGVQYAF
jgi:opacity protein-like surface antigen